MADYLDKIAVLCTCPTNFLMCKTFDSGLCFSDYGVCKREDEQQYEDKEAEQ